jgi:nucleoside-diphosphate-sugar epimerase
MGAARVLLTGAGGFIGSQIARALVEHGAQVHAIVRDSSKAPRLAGIVSKLSIHEGDVLEEGARARLVAASLPEICIHAAWYAVPGKYLEAPENLAHVAASMDLASRVIDAGCKRFVGIGTCFEYALGNAAKPLDESAETGPTFLYSRSKLDLWKHLDAYMTAVQKSFAWCRVFYQYGPMEDAARLVPHVIDRLSSGGVAEMSEGAQVRDFLHVADVGAAIAKVALSDLEGVVNIGSGVPVTVREVVSTVARLCHAEDRVRFGAVPYRPGDPMYVCANVARLRQIGFTPRFDLESGLRDTIAARQQRQQKDGP